MTTPSNPSYNTPEEYFWIVVRVFRNGAAFLLGFWLLLGAMIWLWPWSLIAVETLALIWCLVRIGEGKRYSLRGLLILTAGVAIIMATAAFVPGPMLGGGGGQSFKQTYIEVVDGRTGKPLDNVQVLLTNRDEDLVAKATYEGTTNSQGVLELTPEVGGGFKRSILREWRTYNVKGWLLEAQAPGYHPAEKVLSDVTIYGEKGGPLHFRIELARDQ